MDGSQTLAGHVPTQEFSDMEVGHATGGCDPEQGAYEKNGKRRGSRMARKLGMLEVRLASLAVRQLRADTKAVLLAQGAEVACPDENLLRHIAGSVLAHFEAGAACVVAHVKESWGQEKTRLDSQDGIEWLQDYCSWTNPECSFFALVVFELEKFGGLARSI